MTYKTAFHHHFCFSGVLHPPRSHKRCRPDIALSPVRIVKLRERNPFSGTRRVDKPIIPHVYPHMRIALSFRGFEKHQIARLSLPRPDLLPRIVLAFYRPGQQYSVLFVHVHDITRAVKPPRARTAVFVFDAQVTFCRANDLRPVILVVKPPVSPAVPVVAAPRNAGNKESQQDACCR